MIDVTLKFYIMKLQLFRGMGHLLVSSLIVLTPAAVSCNIAELDDRVTDLENRVDELAADIQDQISSIQGMLEENVSVVSCVLNEETGIYTIVLSSGETIEVSKAGSDASAGIRNNSVCNGTNNGSILVMLPSSTVRQTT